MALMVQLSAVINRYGVMGDHISPIILDAWLLGLIDVIRHTQTNQEMKGSNAPICSGTGEPCDYAQPKLICRRTIAPDNALH